MQQQPAIDSLRPGHHLPHRRDRGAGRTPIARRGIPYPDKVAIPVPLFAERQGCFVPLDFHAFLTLGFTVEIITIINVYAGPHGFTVATAGRPPCWTNRSQSVPLSIAVLIL